MKLMRNRMPENPKKNAKIAKKIEKNHFLETGKTFLFHFYNKQKITIKIIIKNVKIEKIKKIQGKMNLV